LNFFFLACAKNSMSWIAARPAAFNIVNPERIELLGDAELVRDREIDAFALRTVAQGRVIDFNLGFHKIVRKHGWLISLIMVEVANRKTESTDEGELTNLANEQKLSHRHRSRTQKCNSDF